MNTPKLLYKPTELFQQKNSTRLKSQTLWDIRKFKK